MACASENGHISTAELLLAYSRNKSAAEFLHVEYNYSKEKEFYDAGTKGLTSTVEFLLAKGVNPNSICGLTDDPAILLASGNGHKATVELLLVYGADPNTNNLLCDTDPALIRASRNGHTSTVELLLIHGADPNAQDRRVSTKFF